MNYLQRRSLQLCAFCVVMLLSFTSARAANESVPQVAVNAPAPFGVYLGAGCDGRNRLAQFKQWAGREPDFVIEFLAQNSWDAMASAAGWAAKCWQQAGQRVVFSMPMLPKDGVSSFDAGIRGDYDEKIANVVRQLIRQGYGGATIRLGWEFNANWYAWSSTKHPQLFVSYWRRMVQVIRSVPGAQFRFDWNPIVGPGVNSPEPAYPGDDVVDVIGADVYNNNYFPPGTTAEQRWAALRDSPYGLRWHRDFARKRGKPMSFPEWGTGTRPDGHGGGDDPVFMRGMTEWIGTHPLEYHAYWDYPAPDYNARLSDGSKPQAAEIFLRAFGVGQR